MKKVSLFILGLKYTFFAGVAICINIASQELTSRIYSGVLNLELSILAGTIFGFFAKYYLDRKYIFYYRFLGIKDDFKILFLYMIMSVFATLIFWTFELVFDWIFDARYMRYVGAVIGLSIGYTFKYILDKRFVFVFKGN